MLLAIKSLTGLKLNAIDGSVGSSADFLFDDQSWKVRYVVVNTGGWLANRKVLLPASSLNQFDPQQKRLEIDRTKQQIENAPPLASHAPVSKQYQWSWSQYHGIPPYWEELGPLAAPLAANALAMIQKSNEQDEHLRSSEEIVGYKIESSQPDQHGKQLGKLTDLIINSESNSIAFAVIETDPSWFSSDKALIPRHDLETVGWAEQTLYVDANPTSVSRFPSYDANRPLEPQLDQSAYDLYGMPKE